MSVELNAKFVIDAPDVDLRTRQEAQLLVRRSIRVMLFRHVYIELPMSVSMSTVNLWHTTQFRAASLVALSALPSGLVA